MRSLKHALKLAQRIGSQAGLPSGSTSETFIEACDLMHASELCRFRFCDLRNVQSWANLGKKIMAPATTHKSILRGVLAGPLQPPIATYPPGRVCRAKGCRTRLSVYNPTDKCAIHEERRPFLQHARPGREPQDAPRRPMEERDVLLEWIRGLE
jgi:hypothetical protein